MSIISANLCKVNQFLISPALDRCPLKINVSGDLSPGRGGGSEKTISEVFSCPPSPLTITPYFSLNNACSVLQVKDEIALKVCRSARTLTAAKGVSPYQVVDNGIIVINDLVVKTTALILKHRPITKSPRVYTSFDGRACL